jgi:hypothetical protein
MTTNALHLHLLTEDHLSFGHRRPPKGYLIKTKDANNLRTTMMKGMTMMNEEDGNDGNNGKNKDQERQGGAQQQPRSSTCPHRCELLLTGWTGCYG